MTPLSEGLHRQGNPSQPLLPAFLMSSGEKVITENDCTRRESSRYKRWCVKRDRPDPPHHLLQLPASRAPKDEIDASWRLSASGGCLPRCERSDRLDRW